MEYPKTEKTTITRLPKRGAYDQQTIYNILDEALYCNVAFVKDNQPFLIPTGFCRIGTKIYIHGSVGSFYMREIVEKNLPVCISVTLMDALVLARSAFHHSVNYRSVIIFSDPHRVTDHAELDKALAAFTEKMQPGRWADIRKPDAGEWKATMVISFDIAETSAKIRTGGPIDDEDDYALDIWAGIVPLQLLRGQPIADTRLKSGIDLPAYLKTSK
ncbi:MAG TPA: pyridoxamine 5'-phosphate oxidase family protein [Chryseosolibacter sp.]|nr:pyridoxamine 5'-phosphate oxidase family protein [Chryseosolibacter sp.]